MVGRSASYEAPLQFRGGYLEDSARANRKDCFPGTTRPPCSKPGHGGHLDASVPLTALGWPARVATGAAGTLTCGWRWGVKIRLTLKDPDGVEDSMRDAVNASMPEGLSDAENEAVHDIRLGEFQRACRRWVKFGEYVTIEIDTDTDTAVVVEQER